MVIISVTGRDCQWSEEFSSANGPMVQSGGPFPGAGEVTMLGSRYKMKIPELLAKVPGGEE
jgi:hypothetical protein